MFLIDRLAEQHIRDAMEKGEFDDLPGRGKPLALDDDSLVPEHLRAGYRMLKNAGYLPPELELRKEIADVEELIAQACDAERESLNKRLRYLLMQLNLMNPENAGFLRDRDYAEKLQKKFAG